MASLEVVPIEALFRPSTRFRDSHGIYDDQLPYGFTEVELLPGLTIENFRATGVTWKDFCRFLRYKIVWVTRDIFICSRFTSGDEHYPVFLWLGDYDEDTTLVSV
jgi:hypothetical protein